MYIDFEETSKILKNAKDAVIITHQSPDGDCVGAGFGLKDILSELGIRSRVVCSDPFPKRYDFITSIGAGEEFEPQTIISVDVADTQLMGKYEKIYGDRVDLCIDHHVSNKNYAKKTLLNADAAAACEVIYDLAKYMGVNITRHCAMSLYTGMATDTGCFKYECTTARTHEIAAEMKRTYDINFAKINRCMFDVKSKGKMRLEARAVDLFEERLDGKLVILAVTQKMMKELGVEIEELEGLAPLTIQLETAEVGILIREKADGELKCSFRSADKVDVSEIAQTMGGGGHVKAAGCKMRGDIEYVKDCLTEAVRKALV